MQGNKKVEVLVDTNIFLRFFTQDQPAISKQIGTLFDFIFKSNGILYVNNIILMEIYYTLKTFYKLPRERLQKYIKILVSHRNIRLLKDLNPKLALQLFETSHIKFTDCLIASSKFLQKGGVILSYDTDFDKLKIKRKTPEDFLKILNKQS